MPVVDKVPTTYSRIGRNDNHLMHLVDGRWRGRHEKTIEGYFLFVRSERFGQWKSNWIGLTI